MPVSRSDIRAVSNEEVCFQVINDDTGILSGFLTKIQLPSAPATRIFVPALAHRRDVEYGIIFVQFERYNVTYNLLALYGAIGVHLLWLRQHDEYFTIYHFAMAYVNDKNGLCNHTYVVYDV